MPEETGKPDPGHAGAKQPVGPRTVRGRLVAGILIIIPLAVTGILMRYVYNVALTVGATAVNWIQKAIAWAVGSELENAPMIDPENPRWFEVTLAVLFTISLLYLLGWLGSNVVGRRVIDIVENLLERIPLVDTVYGAMKRMVQALSGVGKADEEAKRVVLVDFPHERMKAIGFMTNTLTDLNSGQKLATVYVPTTPNPTSGYMELVPLERITQTDWTMEEALSMILSGGATAPPEVRLRPGPEVDQGAGETNAARPDGKPRGGGSE